ncbi:aspartate carbamoyltransferase catalytic subunit [Niameybacter massiliensis]|uniref:Aspartate carbamoyltransferase n=1 Tax=Holtiella tumoricola TaxID=3018743 RepID=A0AA42DKK4_9FIRM|nr:MULTISPECIES: aspartate carbamoyltransferase catalytic subunit [Lachnospirales]MDA3730613.1 aspartate carbamoyltransferase catalytic subunit [Holtiella tumoricola]
MLKSKDLLGIRDLEVSEIMSILELAHEMKKKITDSTLREDTLKGRSMITLFYENSTRTKVSFNMAGLYQGAMVTDLGVATSSVQKGETLVDTGITLDQMGIDFMVMRHGLSGASHLLAKNVKASVINAGDGANEHPTQALLDLYTMLDKKGSFKDLNVTIVGDIAHSRVARSNVFGLKKLGANVTLAGCGTLASGTMEALGATVTHDIKNAIKGADVVMGLRIQMERQKGGLFPNLREYSQLYGLDEEMFSYADKEAILMHPAPVNRGIELMPELLDSNVSVIDEQVQNGVAVRMAILALLNERRGR